MFKISLEFEIGNAIRTCPVTLIPFIEHPVLDISNSYSGLKSEVREWLDIYLDHKWKFYYDGINYALWFATEADMVLFKMRWL